MVSIGIHKGLIIRYHFFYQINFKYYELLYDSRFTIFDDFMVGCRSIDGELMLSDTTMND